jgi:hypothetical protein
MTEMPHHQDAVKHRRLRRTMKTTMLALAIAATTAVSACSTSNPQAGPTTPGDKPAPTSGPAGSCQVNPESGPMPTVEPFATATESGRISVTLSGITSGTVKPGSDPTEVDVTLCNNSAVSYPKVGVVLVLARCSCATSPMGLPAGTVERFDPATGSWIKLDHPVMGTGMDYLGSYTNAQALPKGKTVTLRYRVALDASMTDGKGGVKAAVVVPDGMIQIGKADLPFTVSTGPTPPTGSTPTPQQTTLPFTGFDNPYAVAADTAGNVYVIDARRVLKLAAGSNTQTVLPFTGLDRPTRVTVDTAANVYVTDLGNRVVKLTAGSDTQTVLPITNVESPAKVAVDPAGNVYVIDSTNRQVVKLASGSNTQAVLPISGLNGPIDVAVDAAGNVYVLDNSGFGQVVKLAAA